MSSAAIGRKIGKASSFSARRGKFHVDPRYSCHRKSERPINKDCSANQGNLIQQLQSGGGEQQRTSRRRGGKMKVKERDRGGKLNLRHTVRGGVVGGKYRGWEWRVLLSLGLTRKVRVCEECPFRHQKIQPLTAHGCCYPNPAQAHPFVRWSAIVCAATAQATW